MHCKNRDPTPFGLPPDVWCTRVHTPKHTCTTTSALSPIFIVWTGEDGRAQLDFSPNLLILTTSPGSGPVESAQVQQPPSLQVGWEQSSHRLIMHQPSWVPCLSQLGSLHWRLSQEPATSKTGPWPTSPTPPVGCRANPTSGAMLGTCHVAWQSLPLMTRDGIATINVITVIQ